MRSAKGLLSSLGGFLRAPCRMEQCRAPRASSAVAAARRAKITTPADEAPAVQQPSGTATASGSTPAAAAGRPSSLPATAAVPTRVVVLGIDSDTHGAIAMATWDTADLTAPVCLAHVKVSVFDTPFVMAVLQKRSEVTGKPFQRRWLDVLTATQLVRQAVPASLPAGHALELRAYIEAPPTVPGNSLVSKGTVAYSVGLWHGVCTALGFTAHTVPVRRWKGDMALMGTDKDASRELATQLFPHKADILLRKMDDGRAEALLIMAWGLGCSLPRRLPLSAPDWSVASSGPLRAVASCDGYGNPLRYEVDPTLMILEVQPAAPRKAKATAKRRARTPAPAPAAGGIAKDQAAAAGSAIAVALPVAAAKPRQRRVPPAAAAATNAVPADVALAEGPVAAAKPGRRRASPAATAAASAAGTDVTAAAEAARLPAAKPSRQRRSAAGPAAVVSPTPVDGTASGVGSSAPAASAGPDAMADEVAAAADAAAVMSVPAPPAAGGRLRRTPAVPGSEACAPVGLESHTTPASAVEGRVNGQPSVVVATAAAALATMLRTKQRKAPVREKSGGAVEARVSGAAGAVAAAVVHAVGSPSGVAELGGVAATGSRPAPSAAEEAEVEQPAPAAVALSASWAAAPARRPRRAAVRTEAVLV